MVIEHLLCVHRWFPTDTNTSQHLSNSTGRLSREDRMWTGIKQDKINCRKIMNAKEYAGR